MTEAEQLQALLADMQAEQQAWDELLERLPADQVGIRVAGEWSVIDTLIHITAWQENGLRVARAQAAADAPALDPTAGASRVLGIDVDRFNDAFFQSHADWTLEQAEAWWRQVNAELQAALRALPAERVLGGPGPHATVMWLGRPTILHPREHRHALERRLMASEGASG